MKVLLLGPEREKLKKQVELYGDKVIVLGEPLEVCSKKLKDIEFIVSYGYRYMISAEVINNFHLRAINLHISMLPWNRGADPNLWSFLEDTPKGVTIHYLDSGLDTGNIIIQRNVPYVPNDTLRTSYERLTKAIEDLFIEWWPKIRVGNVDAVPQQIGGSYHKSSDRNKVEHLLTKGWDTPVLGLIGKAIT